MEEEKAAWVESGGRNRKGEIAPEPDFNSCFQLGVTEYIKEMEDDERAEFEKRVEAQNTREVGLEMWLK